jgi:hypothetical protein
MGGDVCEGGGAVELDDDLGDLIESAASDEKLWNSNMLILVADLENEGMKIS